MKDSIRTTSGILSMFTGTEGCAHDPWSFIEYHWEPVSGQPIELRLGMAVTLRTLANSPHVGRDIAEEEFLREYFWQQVGMTERTFDKALQRLGRGPYAPEDPMATCYGYNI